MFSLRLLLAILLVSPYLLSAQCTILEVARPNQTLSVSENGTDNRSGLTYRADKAVYYSINAGNSSYPMDVFAASGKPLAAPSQGFDYRSIWWNPRSSQLEGNGYDELGIFIQTLEKDDGLPTGEGNIIFKGAQPDIQSVGDFDYRDNEILYYFEGEIYRYDRQDNTFLASSTLSGAEGISPTDLNANSIAYSGCGGLEAILYQYEKRRVLFFNKRSGAYQGYSQLPYSAAKRSSFGMAYANGLFWLFEDGKWRSYQVLGTEAENAAPPANELKETDDIKQILKGKGK